MCHYTQDYHRVVSDIEKEVDRDTAQRATSSWREESSPLLSITYDSRIFQISLCSSPHLIACMCECAWTENRTKMLRIGAVNSRGLRLPSMTGLEDGCGAWGAVAAAVCSNPSWQSLSSHSFPVPHIIQYKCSNPYHAIICYQQQLSSLPAKLCPQCMYQQRSNFKTKSIISCFAFLL